MTAELLRNMAVSLALTLLLELVFAIIWGVRKRGLLLVCLMNLLTNPVVVLVHFLISYYLGINSLFLVAFLEAAAIVTEGFVCRGVVKRPWLFAILINLFSYGVGELLQWILRGGIL